MADATTITWPGKSGKQHQYWIHPIGTIFKEEPGNYIYAKETRPGYWAPCYIGQTKNLNERLEGHEKEACAKRKGATHIHAHTNGNGEAARLAEEKDLILKWQPPCNEQLTG
jgi:predicted GIY-YIG superfamily endonuclease